VLIAASLSQASAWRLILCGKEPARARVAVC